MNNDKPPETELIKQYVTAHKLVEECKQVKKECESRLLRLAGEVQDYFIDNNIKKITVDGMTVFISKRVWATPAKDKEDLIVALALNSETAWLTPQGYNANTLSAWMKELPVDDEGEIVIPDHLKDVLKANEVFQIKGRKG